MDRKYTRKHIWVKEEDGYLKIGITDYAQKSLREKISLIEIDKNSVLEKLL